MRKLIVPVLFVAAWAASSGASAQDGRSFGIQNFKPAPGHGSILTAEGASVPEGLSVGVGGLLDYQYRPLVIRECDEVEGGACTAWDETGGALIEHHLSLEILGSVALFGVFELGVGLPVVLYQTGEDVRVSGGPDLVESPDGHAGLSDLRLHAKLDLLRGLFGYEGKLLDMALVTAVSFPLGNAVVGSAFMGDSSVTVNPKVAFGFNLDRAVIALNAGYLWRESQEYYLADVEPAITYAAATDIDVAEGWGVIVELFGQTGVGGEPASSPLEADAAARRTFGNGLTLLAGLGAGIVGGVGNPAVRAFAGVRWEALREADRDGDMVLDRNDACPDVAEDRDGFEDADGCPDEDNDRDGIKDADDECPDDAEDADGLGDGDGCPEDDLDGDGVPDAEDKCPTEKEDADGFEDADGCPEGDNDGDGIPDDKDKCPTEKEDADGFEDADGCPDPDNDRDRIPDAADKCPVEKETYNNFEDGDGCADEGEELVKMGDEKLELTQKIHFKTNSDKIIKKQSFDTLDIVVGVMSRSAKMRIRIEGHTDSKGAREHNLDLSARRAKAVMKYLVDKGIDAGRLEAIGYGPDKPIEDNATEKGRAANRRVEFHIVEE